MLLALLAVHAHARPLAAPAAAGAKPAALLYTDPERVFDVLSRQGVLASISSGDRAPKALSSADVASLTDDSPTWFTLALPADGSEALLSVKRTRPAWPRATGWTTAARA